MGKHRKSETAYVTIEFGEMVPQSARDAVLTTMFAFMPLKVGEEVTLDDRQRPLYLPHVVNCPLAPSEVVFNCSKHVRERLKLLNMLRILQSLLCLK